MIPKPGRGGSNGLHTALLAALLLGLASANTMVTAMTDSPEILAQRRAMLDAIIADTRATASYTGRSALDSRVMQAMERVRRERFVDADQRSAAYRNHPLPIGSGQTISQPFIVALSTDLVRPEPDDRVLEIGTGSGYQAAVLAELVVHVDSIEIIESLGEQARERLAALGYRNVDVHIGDGYRGLPEKAPYDAIVVTAAAPEIPAPLVDQLAPGGRMVIPVGKQWGEQTLTLVEKSTQGQVTQRAMLPVRFVPMTGQAQVPQR